MRETWVGRVENLVVTKENSNTDWVIVKLSNSSRRAPKWYSLDLSQRTPTSMAMLNIFRDAHTAGHSVRLVINRNPSADPSWQEATIIGVEAPALPDEFNTKFN